MGGEGVLSCFADFEAGGAQRRQDEAIEALRNEAADEDITNEVLAMSAREYNSIHPEMEEENSAQDADLKEVMEASRLEEEKRRQEEEDRQFQAVLAASRQEGVPAGIYDEQWQDQAEAEMLRQAYEASLRDR